MSITPARAMVAGLVFLIATVFVKKGMLEDSTIVTVHKRPGPFKVEQSLRVFIQSASNDKYLAPDAELTTLLQQGLSLLQSEGLTVATSSIDFKESKISWKSGDTTYTVQGWNVGVRLEGELDETFTTDSILLRLEEDLFRVLRETNKQLMVVVDDNRSPEAWKGTQRVCTVQYMTRTASVVAEVKSWLLSAVLGLFAGVIALFVKV